MFTICLQLLPAVLRRSYVYFQNNVAMWHYLGHATLLLFFHFHLALSMVHFNLINAIRSVPQNFRITVKLQWLRSIIDKISSSLSKTLIALSE